MSYKRPLLPKSFNQGEDLDRDLRSIGIIVSSDSASVDANIEDTLIAGVIDEFYFKGSRSVSLITNWIEAHYSRINVDRLYRAISALDRSTYSAVRIFFSAVGSWLSHDRRFEKLTSLYKGERVNYLSLSNPTLPDLTSSIVKKNGEDERFQGTSIIVPNGVIRRRGKDIMSARDIAREHMSFRFRVMMGPSYRADMWAALRRNPTLSASDIGKLAYGSYETARQVKADYTVVKRNYSDRKRVA